MQGFISYTHADAKHLGRLAIHFKAIERLTPFRFWYDRRRLTAGDHFDETIQRVIGVSDVFVLLVSPDFFASDYVFDKELPAIIERSNQAGCPVVPVILTRCLWEAWLEGLLAVPNVPILEWKPVESGFDAANREVAKKIYNWCDIEPTPLLKKFFQGVA